MGISRLIVIKMKLKNWWKRRSPHEEISERKCFEPMSELLYDIYPDMKINNEKDWFD